MDWDRYTTELKIEEHNEKMQNKIEEFKQLSQEFADRKGHGVEYRLIDEDTIESEFYSLPRTHNPEEETVMDFTFYSSHINYNYEVWDNIKELYLGARMTLDQFKKLIEEL